MIDYTNISISIDNAMAYMDSTANVIQWENRTDRATGEIILYKGKYKNLDFELFDADKPRLTVKNSLHTFWHDANYTDFSIDDIREVLEHFNTVLLLDPSKARLHGFEFGVNVATGVIPPVIFGRYMMHKGEPFKPMHRNRIGNKKATGVLCEHSEVRIKAYDKGTQFNLDMYLMRFEVKVSSSRYFERNGFTTPLYLSDLQQPEILAKLGELLILHYDDILQNTETDPVKVAALQSKERELLYNGQRLEYWTDLKNDVEMKQINRATYQRRLKAYESIVERVCGDETTDKIRKSITQKWLQLSMAKNKRNYKNVAYSTGFDNAKKLENHNSDNMPNDTKMSHIQPILSLNLRLSTSLTDIQKDRLSRRVCVVCETDVSERKSSTKTCSKKCRNQLSNSTHDYTRQIRKDVKEVTLFDTLEMINIESLEAKQRKRKKRS